MAADPNWARWVFASVATFLKGVAKTNNLPSIIEGVEDRTKTFMASPNRVEIRISGPFVREPSYGHFKIVAEANVMVTSTYDKPNRYDFAKITGIFQQALNLPIPVYRYGDQPIDDGSYVGHLIPRNNKADTIRVMNFGQYNTTERVRQSIVDTVYYMDMSFYQIGDQTIVS
jgi:hypothetical protein